MFRKFSTVIAILLALALLLPSCNTDNTPEYTDATTLGTNTDDGGSHSDSTTGTTAATTNPIIVPTNIFDEKNIVLSFGAISDIHITSNSSDDSGAKFRAAVTQLRAQAEKHDVDGLDAIAIAGDVTDNGNVTEVNNFARIVDDMEIENLMPVTGNHDVRNESGSLRALLSVMSDDQLDCEVDRSMLQKGARHCVVNGAHFLFVEPRSYSNNVPYDSEVLEWLDTKLQNITTEDPEAYVFVFTHPMLYDTCYGSTLSGGSWYTSYLEDTLRSYPQVITFGGHLHFPINDERSIMQDRFTSVGCGSVRYLAIEHGFSNMASATRPKDAYDVSSGLLVQMDNNGNIRITRMDFSNESTFKEPWEISHPDANNTHLEKYTEDRKDANEAPIFTEVPVLDVEVSAMGIVTKSDIKIIAASDDDFVHHYKIVVKNLTLNTSNTYNFLSDFYRHSDPSDMADELIFPLSIAGVGEYRIEVAAIDSWNAVSAKMSCELTVEAVGGGTDTLPVVYTDFEFTGGQISDTNNKFTVDMQGATITDTTLTFAGTTKTVSAFRVLEVGQHATLRFKDYNASTMTNFYNSPTGYTIEALYVNYAPGGRQGIVCGTQKAGTGLAELDGKPYFYTYAIGGDINASSGSAASKTELNHAVCTAIYDAQSNKTYTALYINGELVASGVSNGEIKISTREDIATALCFGADIANSGKGDDFQTSDFALVDVKIYSDALNQNQVGTAYQNAVDNFKKS